MEVQTLPDFDEHLAREFVQGLVQSAIVRGSIQQFDSSSSAPCNSGYGDDAGPGRSPDFQADRRCDRSHLGGTDCGEVIDSSPS